MTVLFLGAEVFTFSYSVLPAFELPSVRHALRAFGTQICFLLALAFLWFSQRTRISWDVGWGVLAMGALLFGLI